MKKLFIQTYGCQMNFYDSDRMADVLKPVGYELAGDYRNADMVILNTCHIREKAAEKTYSELGRIHVEKKRLADQGKTMTIAVAGCVAQAEGKEIMHRAPFVDIVVGPQAYDTLPDLLSEAERKKRPVNLDFPEVPKFDRLPGDLSRRGPSAFLAVQEGCDKFCTFCVVPYTRGAEYSRPVKDILSEAEKLAEAGSKEIMLLGQNVNAFHGEGLDGRAATLADLIRAVAKIEGIKRIRYTTSHPKDMRDDLITAHAEEEKLMPYLHLPVQSGSDRILKSMNRKHTAESYLAILEKVRAAKPDIALSSDFIVGFPGETEEDFAATLALVKQVGYASSYSFKYSPRPGTPAAEREDQVQEEVKEERLARLQELLNAQQEAFNQRAVGSVQAVLMERPGKRSGQFQGRSPYLQSVYVEDAGDVYGKIVRVRIEKAFARSLTGVILEPDMQIFAHTSKQDKLRVA